MKCNKCKASLEPAKKILLSLAKMSKKPLSQLIICDSCEQPYMCTVKKSKIGVVEVTKKWLEAQTNKDELNESIILLKDMKKMMVVIERWRGYLA